MNNHQKSHEPAEYELPVSLKLSPQSQTVAAANLVSSLQTLGGVYVRMQEEHLHTVQEEGLEGISQFNHYDTIADKEIHSTALPYSNDPTYSHLQHTQVSSEVSNGTYSHLQHTQTSSEVSNGGCEYSKLNHEKEVRDQTSQSQLISSTAYGQRSNPYIFGDQQYAVPVPSEPSQ